MQYLCCVLVNTVQSAGLCLLCIEFEELIIIIDFFCFKMLIGLKC